MSFKKRKKHWSSKSCITAIDSLCFYWSADFPLISFFSHTLLAPRTQSYSHFRSLDRSTFCRQIATPLYSPFQLSNTTLSTRHPSNSKPTNPPLLTPTQWNRCWKLNIPLTARNTWYRTIHNKLPTKQLLRRTHGNQTSFIQLPSVLLL